MTRDVKGKITVQAKKDETSSTLIPTDVEVDEIAIIEIANFIDGFYEGMKQVEHGKVYAQPSSTISMKIMKRYDVPKASLLEALTFYDLLCKKIGRD